MYHHSGDYHPDSVHAGYPEQQPVGLRMNRAVIPADAPVDYTMQEQSVELDYVLPDYYPDVCKLMKCFVSPSIVNEFVHENTVSYELLVEIRILYCSEHSHILQCVTQNLHFSRTAELPPGERDILEILPVTDYVNCRAVSRRRLDVRGAVTVHIRSAACYQQEVLCDIFGKQMQLQKKPLQYQAKRIQATSRVVLAEELELGSARPALLHVVRYEARPVEQSQKFVSGNVQAQGHLQIAVLYACEKDGDGSLESMSFRIPYSQMIELAGVEEQDICHVSCTVVSCDLKPVTDATGDVRTLRCEAELKLSCRALRMASESLVCDAFSTEHPVDTKKVKLVTGGTPVAFSETVQPDVKLSCTDGALDCVYDAWFHVKHLAVSIEKNPASSEPEIQVSGMLCCFVLVREDTGMPKLLEKEERFSHGFTMPGLHAQDRIEADCIAEHCSYTLSDQAEILLKPELHLVGQLTHCTETEVLSELTLHETERCPKQYALKLYFGRAGESVWEIARRCYTSVEAIMEENDLTQETLSDACMLLIPIIQ